MKLEVPKHWVKKRSDICIVCAHNPKEESWNQGGCYAYGKFVRKNHQYIYFDEPEKVTIDTV